MPIGLWAGDFDYVLTPVSRGTFARQLYQWLFYGGLLAVFVDSWRRHAPQRPSWGRWKQFLVYFAQGVVASVVLRVVLAQLGLAGWSRPEYGLLEILGILVGCVAVAVVEEAVFRGFILGHLVSKFGWNKGAMLTSGLFAVVHLFRPGDARFKLMYFLGLFLLGYLLAAIAWHHNSVLASAGFHGGAILLNLWLRLDAFQSSVLAGWNSEPLSGVVSIALTALFFVGWRVVTRKTHAKSS